MRSTATSRSPARPRTRSDTRRSTPDSTRCGRRPIVRCATPHDVSETISFLGRHRLEHVTRSGGHCFGGRSSTRGVVIDVTPMRSISVTGDEVSVGAGTRLGDLYDALQDHDVTLPAGTCPPVGIAGLALGGGLGILGRTYGVTADRLVGAEIVLADGRTVDCDAHHDDELFWALRGAGTGNFGVVTSLRFRTVPAPAVTNLHATGRTPTPPRSSRPGRAGHRVRPTSSPPA